MVSSPASNHFPLLAAALLPFLLGGVARAAAVNCKNQEIVIDAKPGMEVDTRNNNAVLRDVVITQCDMRIEAAEARVAGGLNFDNSSWTVSGGVRISAEGGKLSSDKAIVSFRNKLISNAIVTGSPATFEQMRADGTTSRGRAGSIDYDTASGTVSLSDNAWLLYGRNEITSQKLVYNLRTQNFQGQGRGTPGAASSPGGKDRIRIVIQPPKANEKPNEKSGEKLEETPKKP